VFELHPQLAKDCRVVGDLKLCRVLLANDSNYPWLILVPMRENIQEAFQLSLEDQAQLLKESTAVSEAIYKHFSADKLNVAALGNMVPQLHIHHIVRYRNDPAWPKPVWGTIQANSYSETEINVTLSKLKELLFNS